MAPRTALPRGHFPTIAEFWPHGRGATAAGGADSSGALDGPVSLGGEGDGGIASRAGLGLREGPVRRTEAQGERHGLLALADLRPGVDVEEAHRLHQLTCALAQRARQRGDREVEVDDESDVL